MNNLHKNFPYIGILAIVFSPNLVGFSPAPIPPAENADRPELSLKFPSGRRGGSPAITAGAGARNNPCTEEGKLSLNALTPNYKNVVTTASATPTLYFYIPPTPATLGELLLTDENGNKDVHNTLFTLPRQPGIAKLTLPPQATLVSGKQYEWTLTIICPIPPTVTTTSPPKKISIKGQLKYQKLDSAIAQSLKTKEPLERAKFYARQGYWLDTLDNVAIVRSKQQQEWTELLKSVGLEALATLPFVECCAPN